MIRFFGRSFLGSAALLMLLWGAFRLEPGVARENGPLESLQAFLLTATLAMLLVRLPHWRRWLQAWIGLFLGVGVLSMLLRELEFDRFDLPGWLISLGDGPGRDLLLGLLWLLVVATAIGRRHHLAGWIQQGLRSDWGWAFLLGGSFYLLGSFFDQKVFPLPRPTQLFWEEAMETVAVVFIGLGVVRWLASQGRSGHGGEGIGT